jgi:hypothetical protein
MTERPKDDQQDEPAKDESWDDKELTQDEGLRKQRDPDDND